MKTLFTLLLFSFSLSVFAQIVSIPDPNFKAILLAHDPVIDTNSDGEIQISEAEAFSGVLVFENAGIADLAGLEAFLNVTQIYCSQNVFTSIPLSTLNNLTNLVAWNNQLESLDVSQNPSLFRVDIGGNNVSSLDITNNPELVEISIGNNSISNLDLSNNPLLQRFYSSNGNTHTFLDFSSNPVLNTLVVQNIEELQFINIQNGNTSGITNLNLTGLSGLSCVKIDSDVLGNIPESWVYDEGTNFSNNCEMSIEEIQTVKPKLYPNPVKNELNIQYSELIHSIEIYSLSGKKLIRQKGDNINKVPVNQLEKGTYIVRILTQTGKAFTQKILIK